MGVAASTAKILQFTQTAGDKVKKTIQKITVGFAAMLVVPALWFLARWAKRLLGAPDEPG